MERFIIIECEAPIKTLGRVLTKPLLKYIIRSNKLLPPQDFDTLVNLTKFTYNFDDKIEISKESCMSLYETLIGLG